MSKQLEGEALLFPNLDLDLGQEEEEEFPGLWDDFKEDYIKPPASPGPPASPADNMMVLAEAAAAAEEEEEEEEVEEEVAVTETGSEPEAQLADDEEESDDEDDEDVDVVLQPVVVLPMYELNSDDEFVES